MVDPLVSVIIPTYNATWRLKDAIDSAINQTYNNIEIIVVDDNDPKSESREFTEMIMKGFAGFSNIFYLKHSENKNGSAARNTGIRFSKGSYISFLDDDDYYYKDRIDKSVKLLENNPEYVAVYSSVDLYENDKKIGERLAKVQGKIWKELLLNEGLLGTGSNLFLKKNVLESLGGFDERFLRYQDVELMLRVSEKSMVLATDELLVRKNILPTNIPKYPKYKENKNLIFEKFDYLLNNLTEEERQLFFSSHYESLFVSALNSCKRAYIKEALTDLKKAKGKLPKKYYLKSMFPHLYKLFQKLF